MSDEGMKPWSLTVCEDCGEPTRTTHRHKPTRNGIITYSGLREIEVVPKADLERAERDRRTEVELTDSCTESRVETEKQLQEVTTETVEFVAWVGRRRDEAAGEAAEAFSLVLEKLDALKLWDHMTDFRDPRTKLEPWEDDEARRLSGLLRGAQDDLAREAATHPALDETARLSESHHHFANEVSVTGSHFAKCTCGWMGTWWPTLTEAREAWKRHIEGAPNG